MLKRKIWKLKNQAVSKTFYRELSRCVTEHTAAAGSVEEQYKAIKSNLLRATDLVCGWTKGPPRHKVTWWWDEEVEAAVTEKKKIV